MAGNIYKYWPLYLLDFQKLRRFKWLAAIRLKIKPMIYLLLFAVLHPYITGFVRAHREAKEREGMARLWVEIEKERQEMFWKAVRDSGMTADQLNAYLGRPPAQTNEQQLHDAIAREDYETAARIRDEINGVK